MRRMYVCMYVCGGKEKKGVIGCGWGVGCRMRGSFVRPCVGTNVGSCIDRFLGSFASELDRSLACSLARWLDHCQVSAYAHACVGEGVSERVKERVKSARANG